MPNTTTAPTSLPAPAPPRWNADDPVVGKRLVVDRRAAIPRFGQDEWDLSCLGSSATRPPFKLDFARLAPRWRVAAKELVAQRVNQPVPSLRAHRRPKAVGPATCKDLLGSMVKVFAFLDERKVASIPAIAPEDLEAFRELIAEEVPSPSSRYNFLKTFDRFRESRAHLSGGGLSFHPWPGANIAEIAGMGPRDENETERIPEIVMRPLLFWALAYVDRFSADILAAEAERRRRPDASVLAEAERRARLAAPARFRKEEDLVARGRTPPTMAMRNEKRMEVYLENLAAAGEGVPAKVFRGRMVLDVDRIAVAAGVDTSYVATSKDKGKRLILASGLPMRLEHLPRATTRIPGARDVWRDRFTPAELAAECRRLQTAAYVVVAYLSGMRDGEVQTLRRGCLEVLKDERGSVYRHKLAGMAHKVRGRRSKPRKWVVIEPVARAVRILERLTAHLHASQCESYLFAQIDHRDDTMGLFQTAIGKHLNAFASHCRDRLAPRQAGADLPPPGPRWRLRSRQFRRTLAWHIANRPFGVVAGMIQYGHSSIQMFEGYAGTSDSGFAAEVDNERMLANLAGVAEMFEAHGRGVMPAGPMAAELSEFFARKRAEIGAFPGEVADAKRVRELLKQKAADLHPGTVAHCFYRPSEARCGAAQTADPVTLPLVNCFYKPSRARCQERVAEGDRIVPSAALCDPDCANACWPHEGVDAWRALRDESKDMMKSNWMGARQKQIVAQKAALAARVVAEIEAAAGGAG